MTDGQKTHDPTLPVPEYPRHWEADVVLSDGGVVQLRPVRSDDREALRRMHSRMSSRSLYLRYFSAVSTVSEQILDSYIGVDHQRDVTLVAELGGELIAAGSYHLDATKVSAEVAFTVQDSQQGRGLGSILLEHLAAAAQERGIRKFTAEVLAENFTMVRVFVDAGYQVTKQYSSGIVDLQFGIEPTDKSRAVLIAREQRSEAHSIARLLAPRSIAVIGASNEPTKLGHAVLANLLAGPFAGPVYPVHPEAVAVQGVRAYRDVTEIPDEVDVAVVTVPAATVAEVVQGCRRKGVHGLVVVTGGFADASDDGAQAQRSMVSVARANGMRVLGPNCLGMVNTDPAVQLNATLASQVPPPGRVGFFCQSGALGIAVLADAATRGLGLSSFVSAGNRADVSGNDLLQFWQSDSRTEVVLLYLESFGNPRKFARLARTLARSKPVIAVKSGRHALLTPGLAASSMSLSDAAVNTVFAQSGVIRTDTLGQAFDVAQLLSTQPLPTGSNVAVLGNSTALGVLAADACLDAGLTVAGLAPKDLGVNVSPGDLAEAVRASSADPEVDAVVVVFVPPVAVQGDRHATALRDVALGSTVPIVSTFLAADGLVAQLTVPTAEGGAARGSVPSYRTPERAVAALASAATYARWRQRPLGEVRRPDGIEEAAGRSAIASWLQRSSDGAGADPDAAVSEVDEGVLLVLLSCYGIEVSPFGVADCVADAVSTADRLGYPVVLKTFDRRRRDSLLGGGVRPSLQTPIQVQAAFEVLSALASGSVYVQQMAPPEKSGVSTVFGVGTDPSFGALVSFGISGLATDLLEDRGYRAVPLTDVDAADLIDSPRAAPLLAGYGGRTPVDRGALQDLSQRISALADDVPELSEIHLRVLAGSGGCTVIGATALAGPPPVPLDARRRMR